MDSAHLSYSLEPCGHGGLLRGAAEGPQHSSLPDVERPGTLPFFCPGMTEESALHFSGSSTPLSPNCLATLRQGARVTLSWGWCQSDAKVPDAPRTRYSSPSSATYPTMTKPTNPGWPMLRVETLGIFWTTTGVRK